MNKSIHLDACFYKMCYFGELCVLRGRVHDCASRDHPNNNEIQLLNQRHTNNIPHRVTGLSSSTELFSF